MRFCPRLEERMFTGHLGGSHLCQEDDWDEVSGSFRAIP
jgi:hypothetical protein